MKLVIPHTGTLQPSDDRLSKLAQFLGVTCEPLFLGRESRNYAEYLSEALLNQDCCLAINPQVIEQWTGGTLPAALVSCLTSRFRYLLVHGLTEDCFSEKLLKALSNDRLCGVRRIADTGQQYEIAANSRDICEAFSGVSFGPVNAANDHVFSVKPGNPAVRTPITIGGDPFMAVVKLDKTEIVFLASKDTLDVNREIANARLSEYFSRFLPHAMAVRYMFGEESWRPVEHHASIIIDDPLLRPTYGFLNFERLLRLVEEFNLFVTIAFIPYNYRRNSKRIVRMFRENRERLAICFHGNDHTTEELASSDISRLNTMLDIAESRMSIHHESSGVDCHKVMVFPQEYFSVEAMKVLKSRNFHAATSSMSHPAHRAVYLTLAELAQPAVLRYGGFPLFLRKYSRDIKKQDVAFNLFFGRPILIVDHHDVFRCPDTLLEAVSMVKSVAPGISWCDLETAVAKSTLTRTSPDGTRQIRAYSGTVRIVNDRDSLQRYSVEWNDLGQSPAPEQVREGGKSCRSFQVDESGTHVALELAPGQSETLSLVYRNNYPRLPGLGFSWRAKAYLRRRLSEVRDNYVSKNRHVLALAKILQQRVLANMV
jgi:hypothetical protein